MKGYFKEYINDNFPENLIKTKSFEDMYSQISRQVFKNIASQIVRLLGDLKKYVHDNGAILYTINNIEYLGIPDTQMNMKKFIQYIENNYGKIDKYTEIDSIKDIPQLEYNHIYCYNSSSNQFYRPTIRLSITCPTIQIL